MTAEELFERMRHAGPPTGDDVPVTFGGRPTLRMQSGHGWPIWRPAVPPPTQMTAAEGPPLDLRRLIAALNRHGVNYRLCGGAAATAYGAERRSEDADCV